MSWVASDWRQEIRRKPRAIAWTCTTDRRLVVRHCGHPTALRPYFLVIDGVDMYPTRGAFRLLAVAQHQAELAVMET